MPGGVATESGIQRLARGQYTESGREVVGCIEVEAVSSVGARSVNSGVLWGLAVRRVERCLRPGDWLCPMGAGRIGICFGGGAHLVDATSLGARLARALGDHLAVGANDLDLHVAVGVGTGESGVCAGELTSSALSALASERRRSCSRAPRRLSSPRVVVTHLRASGASSQWRPPVRRLLVTVGPGHDLASQAQEERGTPAKRRPVRSQLDLLVVDTQPMTGDRENPGVEGVVAVARRLGIEPRTIHLSDPLEVVAAVRRDRPDVVVIPLRSPLPGQLGTHRHDQTPWEQWASTTRELVHAGATVFAVGVGASVAAVAACVREGAVGLLDLWEFAEQIEKIEANLGSRRLSREASRAEAPAVVRTTLPHPYGALVELTTSEHRVLYHMVRGASASEIAEQLVVTLATVRSHIRSILRKLGVSSQLAAVALANGAQPETVDAI